MCMRMPVALCLCANAWWLTLIKTVQSTHEMELNIDCENICVTYTFK